MIELVNPLPVETALDSAGAVPVTSATPDCDAEAMLIPGLLTVTVTFEAAPLESPPTVTLAPERDTVAAPLAVSE